MILVMLSLITYCLNVVKTREPKDKQLCITVYAISNDICDADPLDNSSNIVWSSGHCLI